MSSEASQSESLPEQDSPFARIDRLFARHQVSPSTQQASIHTSRGSVLMEPTESKWGKRLKIVVGLERIKYTLGSRSLRPHEIVVSAEGVESMIFTNRDRRLSGTVSVAEAFPWLSEEDVARVKQGLASGLADFLETASSSNPPASPPTS